MFASFVLKNKFEHFFSSRYDIIKFDGSNSILGRATVGGICKTTWVSSGGSFEQQGIGLSINEDTGLTTTASTGAHELGHK